MRVFNETKTNELTETEYDLEKGYLKPDVLETEIPEQQAVEEKSHLIVKKAYANGGNELDKIIDVPYKPYIPAHTEREDILVYIPYTDEELERIAIKREIEELKANLLATDYKAIKYAEGKYTKEEYAPIDAQREAWRDRINKLEAIL